MPRLSWIVSLALAACTPSVEKPSEKEDAPARRELPGPSLAICEPTGCALYCVRLGACEGTSKTCEADCLAVCGDGYFDDRDGPLMACVLGDTGEACAAKRRCCDIEFTSQLCAHD